MDNICGQPVKRVRDLLRKLGSSSWAVRPIASELEITPTEAEKVVAELMARGWLEPAEPWPEDKETYYRLGPEGSRVTAAKMLPPINRAKADAVVRGLLDRIKVVNANPELVYVVAEARVFGSYIDPEATDFADVDVAVRLEPRDPTRDRRDIVQAEQDRAALSGHSFGLIERLSYGQTEVRRILKGRQRYLSLHTFGDLENIGAACRQLWPRRNESHHIEMLKETL